MTRYREHNAWFCSSFYAALALQAKLGEGETVLFASDQGRGVTSGEPVVVRKFEKVFPGWFS